MILCVRDKLLLLQKANLKASLRTPEVLQICHIDQKTKIYYFLKENGNYFEFIHLMEKFFHLRKFLSLVDFAPEEKFGKRGKRVPRFLCSSTQITDLLCSSSSRITQKKKSIFSV